MKRRDLESPFGSSPRGGKIFAEEKRAFERRGGGSKREAAR